MKAAALPSNTNAEPASQPRVADSQHLTFHRLLVPTDFSQPSLKALDYALSLSASDDSEVRLFHALPPTSEFLNYVNFETGAPMPINKADITQICKDLEHIAEEHVMPGHAMTYRTVVGSPATEILTAAAEFKSDLLVISTHGRTGLKHLMLGSVTERVIRQSPCPVLVLRKHEREFCQTAADRNPTPDRILVPVDFSPQSLASVRYAVKFASSFGSKVSIMHALYPVQRFVNTEYATGTAALADVVMRRLRKCLFDLVPMEVSGEAIVRTGPPLAEIPALAEQGNYDLIICASNSGSIFRYMLLGSTAEGIVRHAGCPVLVVAGKELEG